MNIERDKFLIEVMGFTYNYHCPTCKMNTEDEDYNFSTWEGFGILYEWMQAVGPMPEFTNTNRMINLINPDKFADAVYKFLKN